MILFVFLQIYYQVKTPHPLSQQSVSVSAVTTCSLSFQRQDFEPSRSWRALELTDGRTRTQTKSIHAGVRVSLHGPMFLQHSHTRTDTEVQTRILQRSWFAIKQQPDKSINTESGSRSEVLGRQNAVWKHNSNGHTHTHTLEPCVRHFRGHYVDSKFLETFPNTDLNPYLNLTLTLTKSQF